MHISIAHINIKGRNAYKPKSSLRLLSAMLLHYVHLVSGSRHAVYGLYIEAVVSKLKGLYGEGNCQ